VVIIKDLYTPHIIGRGRRSRKSGGAKLSRPLAIILAIVFLAFGAVSAFVFVIPNIGVRLDRRHYYILTLGTTSNLIIAESLSYRVRSGGGGGFIINDGVFHIAAAAYFSMYDAISVADRMSGDFETGVLVVSIDRVRVQEFGRRAYNRTLRDSLLFAVELVDFVVYQNLRLDRGDTSDSAIIYLLETRVGHIEDNIKKLDELIYSVDAISDFLVYTIEFYQQFLYDFISTISVGEEGLLTHRLKYFSVKYILAYQRLVAGG